MNVENFNSWVSQPDVCRCCLSTSGTWDLTSSYLSENGVKEIYSNMLQECFGIALSYLTEWGPSHLVCSLCVGHLQDACSFRKQVLQAESHFINYSTCRQEGTYQLEIKTETEATEEGIHDCYTNDLGALSNDDNHEISKDTDGQNKTKYNRKKRQKTSSKVTRRRKKIVDCDSDTPIAELSRKNELLEQTIMVETEMNNEKVLLKENELKDNSNTIGISNIGRQHPQNSVKHVSERKRIMLTCDTVLKETTACPFRHHKSWFQCFFCTQDFMEINLLRHHTLQTHPNIGDELKKIKRYPRSLQVDISNLECRHCNLNLTDVIAMRRHFSDVHKKVIYNECIADYKIDASPYNCHLCERQFHVFRTLSTHLNEHYANCICDVCGKSYLNSKRLKVHKRTHEDGHYPCSECGKILKTKTSKANHMESAHSKRIIKCQICLKPMKHYNDRIKHMSEAHNITHKFKCPICSREYNIKHYLATHIRQTHGHKNKKCTECGMAFITNHGLKKHMFKHSGTKPYSCSVCCKSYARSYTLREHMRAHDNDRRFSVPE